MVQIRSMSDIYVIAASGMAANAAWLDAIASNVANARNESPLPPAGSSKSAASGPAYQPVAVNMNASASGGVSATVAPVAPSHIAVYDPPAPFANAQGLVAVSNVDLATAVVDQTTALQSYRANAAVLTTAEQMAWSAINTMA